MSGERPRRTTTSRDSNRQHRVSSLPASLVPLLREPPSASSLDDDEQRPALPSPHYEPSRPVLPSITTPQARQAGNLRHRPTSSLPQSHETRMRLRSASADSDGDDEQHHDLGGHQYHREATSHIRETPQAHRQPHQPQSQPTPLSAPVRPHSALDAAYLSDLSTVSATSSARGAPPPSHASAGTSSDSSVASERMRRRSQDRSHQELASPNAQFRPPGVHLAIAPRDSYRSSTVEHFSSGQPDVEYELRNGRRTRFPVSTMRGSSRTSTPSYEPIRSRVRESGGAGSSVLSDGEQDNDPGSSVRARQRGHGHHDSESSGVAQSPISPQFGGVTGQYLQGHTLSARLGYSQSSQWSFPRMYILRLLH